MNLRTNETKCNSDSEQIEHTVTKSQMRNYVSVEQIQDVSVVSVESFFWFVFLSVQENEHSKFFARTKKVVIPFQKIKK